VYSQGCTRANKIAKVTHITKHTKMKMVIN
jgi:hypothetical protein